MVDMEEGRRNQIRSFFGCTLGERNEKYKKGISAFLVFLSNRFFHLRRGLEYRGTDSEGICAKRKWMTEEELLDTVSVGRSLPGLMIGNVSFMFGYQNGGVFCAIMSLLGISVPALLIMTVVTMCYTKIKDNLYVARAMTGIRAAVVPIIGSAGLRLRKGAYTDKLCYGISVIMFVCCAFLNWNCAALIVASACVGLVLKREVLEHGAS